MSCTAIAPAEASIPLQISVILKSIEPLTRSWSARRGFDHLDSFIPDDPMDICVDGARFCVAATYDAVVMIVNFAYRVAGRGPRVGHGIVLSIYVACCI